jgi:DNA helicase-2/ATP-dependent DNA helicase PcrA
MTSLPPSSELIDQKPLTDLSQLNSSQNLASDLPYLRGLNDEQQKAVLHIHGPLLVLAGAGTGKTRVLTTRIAHLLSEHHAFPSQILAVTFTNKAALEMRERLAHLTPSAVDGLWLGTFHAICTRILRRHHEALNFPQAFNIIDGDDQIRLIKQLLKQHNLDPKYFPPKNILNHIQRWKDQAYLPDQVPLADADRFLCQVAEIYQLYQDRLTQMGSVDFGDLILLTINLFEQHPEILTAYQEKFRFLLVDEYQDTNSAQYRWLRLLTKTHHHICCVGDDDQAIYRWRGADVGHILQFSTDYPGATIIRLEQNYRSTMPILYCASALISHNSMRLGKQLWTEQQEGDLIRIRRYWDDREEAEAIAEYVTQERARYGTAYRDMAILVRASFQTRIFEELFMQRMIPYRVIGGLRFYDRQEIKDVIAYLRILTQPDDDLALERIINVPKRQIGASTIGKAYHEAHKRHTSLMEALRLMINEQLLGRSKQPIELFIQQLDQWREALRYRDFPEIVEQLLQESGYLAMWKAERSEEANGRIDNIRELVKALSEFSSLDAFLEHVSLVSERDQHQDDDRVNMMTLHGAKGLEFPVVCLPGWEEGLFPHQRAIDEQGSDGVEEERRLAYVGITRAKTRLFISHAKQRRLYNQWHSSEPSRFIAELPDTYCDTGNTQSFRANRPSSPTKISSSATHLSSTNDINNMNHKAPTKTQMRVIHPQFGEGIILSVNGDISEIAFLRGGIRKIASRFLKRI